MSPSLFGALARHPYRYLAAIVAAAAALLVGSALAAAGQLTTTTDALGHVTTKDYDATGNLSRVTNPLANATTLVQAPRAGRSSTWRRTSSASARAT